MRSTRKALSVFLEAESGVIINMASAAALHGSRAGVAYSAAKHAVVGLTKNVGFQYATKGIRCNAIAPGGVNTKLLVGSLMSLVWTGSCPVPQITLVVVIQSKLPESLYS